MPDDDANGFDDVLSVRIKSESLEEFKRKSMKTTGKPYSILTREIVDAFNQGRLRILKPESNEEELYVN